MRVFMLGWEFPPHISGGLGTACFGLTKGLDEIGVDVTFVLPKPVPLPEKSHVQLISPTTLSQSPAPGSPATLTPGTGPFVPSHQPMRAPEGFTHLEMHRLDAVLRAYAQPGSGAPSIRQLLTDQPELASQIPAELLPDMPEAPWSAAPAGAPPGASGGASLPSGTFDKGAGADYQGDLMGQVYRYARLADQLARRSNFDVIHAHDWMTYPAALAAAAASGKPLVVHVHSTEFDRSGDNVNQEVYDIERMGMHAADRVVCVSHLTGRVVAGRYGVPKDKIEVVYNAVDTDSMQMLPMKPIRQTEKIVLFLGRVTMQKGPEYFLRAAKKVVEKFAGVRFVVAGSGDMITQCIQEVAELRLGKHVTFTGFLRGADVDRIFSMADLYVMPSVSEPFGIAPLEALGHDVPVIISRQSGVSEVLTHVLKVDFWDVDEMANKILAVLRHAPLRRTLKQHGQIELRKLSWRDSACKLREIYTLVTGGAGS